ncbi:vegetative cell wall protein gp1-like [Perognathus longimembris pacificus]|uniref:vegetative cell wall protein gp1-like n=1 Tax=Perognathus longimembris pacificus TaxID=214514 RepID=UPI00201996BE|nr:vegetative cell wall protein gp1-like [Perognathus longimembris pacificus]
MPAGSGPQGPPGHAAPRPRCPPATLPPGHAAPRPRCPPATLPPGHAVPRPRCPPATLPPGHAAPRPRCPPATLSPSHAAPRPRCPPASESSRPRRQPGGRPWAFPGPRRRAWTHAESEMPFRAVPSPGPRRAALTPGSAHDCQAACEAGAPDRSAATGSTGGRLRPRRAALVAESPSAWCSPPPDASRVRRSRASSHEGAESGELAAEWSALSSPRKSPRPPHSSEPSRLRGVWRRRAEPPAAGDAATPAGFPRRCQRHNACACVGKRRLSTCGDPRRLRRDRSSWVRNGSLTT